MKATNVVLQPDGDSDVCNRCHESFTLFNRRHHCRHCGKLFCNACCSNRFPSVWGDPNPQRVCIGCVPHYAQWKWKAQTLWEDFVIADNAALEHAAARGADVVKLKMNFNPDGTEYEYDFGKLTQKNLRTQQTVPIMRVPPLQQTVDAIAAECGRCADYADFLARHAPGTPYPTVMPSLGRKYAVDAVCHLGTVPNILRSGRPPVLRAKVDVPEILLQTAVVLRCLQKQLTDRRPTADKFRRSLRISDPPAVVANAFSAGTIYSTETGTLYPPHHYILNDPFGGRKWKYKV
jgi:hypothetical protein